MKNIIRIQGAIINQAPAKVGYCYTLKEQKTNKQYFFFNTWKLSLVQDIIYAFSLQAKHGKNKYYLFYQKSTSKIRKRTSKRVDKQEVRTSQEEQQLRAINKLLVELNISQKLEIRELRQLLAIKQREIDNKSEYQAQNIFEHLARIYYKTNRNATEQQLLNEVDNLFNDTYLGKKWMFDFRMKQNYWSQREN